jgi:hypothetical protein
MVEKWACRKIKEYTEFIFRDWSAFSTKKTTGSVNSGVQDKWITNKMYLASDSERVKDAWCNGRQKR